MFVLRPYSAARNCFIYVFCNFCRHILTWPILQQISLKGQGTGTPQEEFLGVAQGTEMPSDGYGQGESWNNSAVM